MLDQNGVLVNLALSGSGAAPAASPSPSPGTGGAGGSAGSVSYAGELVLAAVIVGGVLALAALVWWLWGRSKSTANGGLFVGVDNRVSTSKTIAVAWTVVVAWMVVSVALVAALPNPSPGTFSKLLSSASDLYFVFLGGPYAAAAFAKASVQSKVAQGTLTKTTSGSPSPSDLINDDYGNTDLYDSQYVLFNILALVIVIISFGAHPEQGLPDIPAFLAILTGGSALTYTVNKAIATGGAQITDVTPAKARIRDVITITGVQLIPTTPGAPLPTVTIGGISATGVTVSAGPTIDTITATVADAPTNTIPLAGPADVVVSSPQASPITKQKGIEIVADQLTITDVQPQPVTGPGLITVTGTLLLAPGTPSDTAAAGTASVGGGLAAALTVSGSPWPVTIEGPYSQTELTLRLGALPAALTPGTTGEATLTLTRGALQCPPKQIRYEIPGITSVTPANARIGDVITIAGVQLISTTPGAALPTVTVGGISATAVTVSAGSPNTLTATVADTTPLAAALDVVVSPPGASPITSHSAIAIVADQLTITGVQPQPVTGPGPITVTGTLLLAPGTPSGTAAAGTSSVGGLTAALTVTGDSWPITIEGPYSDDTLTLHVGTPPAALSSGAPGDATLTLTRGALNATEQVRYALT